MSVTEPMTDPASEHDSELAADPATTRRAEWIAGMRALVDFVEATPDLPLPDHWGATLHIFVDGDDQVAKLIELRRALGHAEKHAYGQWFSLTRWFGPHGIEITAHREQVCEQVVVGEETVEEPDPEAVAALPKRPVTRPIVEWRCPGSLLSPAEVEAGKAGVEQARAVLAPVENEPV